jgi:hypothetical protein
VWNNFTGSEYCPSSYIALKMEAVRTTETSVYFYEIHCATSHKIVIFKKYVIIKLK